MLDTQANLVMRLEFKINFSDENYGLELLMGQF